MGKRDERAILTSYLIAGARVTGHRVSRNINGGLNITTPDGVEYVGHSNIDWPARVRDERGIPQAQPDGQAYTTRDLLERNQPDRVSSASVQYYIETGHYLPVSETREEN